MGSPRSPKSPKTHKTRFRMPWDFRKTGSPRIKAFFKGGDFVRLMNSKDKRNARATLEAQDEDAQQTTQDAEQETASPIVRKLLRSLTMLPQKALRRILLTL